MSEPERAFERTPAPHRASEGLQGASIAVLCLLLALFSFYTLYTKGAQGRSAAQGAASVEASLEATRTSADAATTDTAIPRLVVEKERVDLGKIKLGKTVRVDIGLANAGQQPLRITEPPYVEVVEGCCPPDPVVGATSLAPGQTTQLSMQFMMHEGMGGKHLFRIHVKTNDPKQPDRTLDVLSNWVK